MKGGSTVSAPEGNKQRDYSRYDQMSTAELEQLLRLDFQASKDGDSDLDAILYISDLLAKRNGPSDSDAAWAQFQTKYRPYADGRSLYDFEDGEAPSPPEAEQPPAPARSRSVRRLRRLALLAAALIACLLGGMAVAQAAGLDVWRAIAQWTDETFRFVSAGSDAASGFVTDQEDASQSQPPLHNTQAMEALLPTWHPDGFTPGELEFTQLIGSESAHVTFFGEDRAYSVAIEHYTQPHNNTGTFEKDDTPVEEYVHNGQTFYILSNLDTLTATTYDGEFLIMIYGALTREEIKAVIDSIPDPQAGQNRAQVQSYLDQAGQSLPCLQLSQGFTRSDSSFYADSANEMVNWSELYTRGDDSLVFGLAINAAPSDTIYEKDDAPVEEYVYDGVTHYIFRNTGATAAAWMAGNTEYYMWATDGAVDMKELIRPVYEA